jgi:hypothetical protein
LLSRSKVLKRRPAYLITYALVAIVALGEGAIRFSGLVNFPLYVKHPSLGYIPAPNQNGVYRNGNDWAYNELSMGIARPFNPGPRPVTLLIGDSIVNGDYWLRQSDTLGPQLENAACGSVWPVSAGGWALLNEIQYFRQHQELLGQTDRIIFVLNSGDFVTASRWTSELTYPTYRRTFWLPYVLRRYVLRQTESAPQARETSAWRSELRWLAQSFSGRIAIALYPLEAEMSDETMRLRQLDQRATDIASVAPGRFVIVHIGQDRRWTGDVYRDGVHPNGAGTKVLAQILREAMDECRL